MTDPIICLHIAQSQLYTILISILFYFSASIAIFGSIIGSWGGGIQSEYLGRKKSMMVSYLIGVCGIFCIRFATGISLLLIGRFLLGYTNASVLTCSASYTGEICQPGVRKYTGTFGPVFYNLGYAIMYLFGVFLHWRAALSILVCWPFTCVIALYFCPESPTWLMNKDRRNEAKSAMVPLRASLRETEAEIKRLEENIKKQKVCLVEKQTYFKRMCILLKQGTFVRPFLVLVVLMTVGMQYTGAPPLAFYLVPILQKSKVPISAYTAAALLASYRVIIVIISTFLTSVIPRRPLYMCASFIAATGALILGTASYLDHFSGYIILQKDYPIIKWIPVFAVFMMYTGFCGGCGPVIFTLLGELLPSNLRALGTGMVSAICFISLFLVIKLSPFFQEQIGLHGMYWGFSGVGYSMIAFILFCVPETFGRSLEDIEEHYRKVCYGDNDKKINNEEDKESNI